MARGGPTPTSTNRTNVQLVWAGCRDGIDEDRIVDRDLLTGIARPRATPTTSPNGPRRHHLSAGLSHVVHDTRVNRV